MWKFIKIFFLLWDTFEIFLDKRFLKGNQKEKSCHLQRNNKVTKTSQQQEWKTRQNNILKGLRGKNCHANVTYSAKLSLKNKVN